MEVKKVNERRKKEINKKVKKSRTVSLTQTYSGSVN